MGMHSKKKYKSIRSLERDIFKEILLAAAPAIIDGIKKIMVQHPQSGTFHDRRKPGDYIPFEEVK